MIQRTRIQGGRQPLEQVGTARRVSAGSRRGGAQALRTRQAAFVHQTGPTTLREGALPTEGAAGKLPPTPRKRAGRSRRAPSPLGPTHAEPPIPARTAGVREGVSGAQYTHSCSRRMQGHPAFSPRTDAHLWKLQRRGAGPPGLAPRNPPRALPPGDLRPLRPDALFLHPDHHQGKSATTPRRDARSRATLSQSHKCLLFIKQWVHRAFQSL